MTKLINISNDLYKKLEKMKGQNSFTILIETFLNEQCNSEKILKFAGILTEDEGQSLDKHITQIKGEWKKWKIDCV